jgi:hypothetical protein
MTTEAKKQLTEGRFMCKEPRRMAQRWFNAAVRDDMGIFLIAEAWGIKPYRVTRHGRGLLTEPYVVENIAKQIEVHGAKVEMEAYKTVKDANSKPRRERKLCSV